MIDFSYYLSRIFLPFLLFTTTALVVAHEDPHQKNFYIVYLGDRPVNEASAAQSHVNLLTKLKGSEDTARESIVYSYHRTFNAFAAKLSENEANTLSVMDGVLSVFKNRYHKLHTTKSWDFIGFPQTAKRSLKTETNLIVALLDTGITPESESFRDDGFGPPPTKWKGTCNHYANFSGCNNKLIGARYFKLDGTQDPEDILSPIDVEGHGTHTSSTLAGNLVRNASLFGLANGTARGAVPSARIAMYKVCWASNGCADMDILAAFDAAIADGVDVISISIGGGSVDYVSDSISVGSFHAMRKGALTVSSGGNDGPTLGSVANHAPWMLTVAASGIDRQFRSRVSLSNGRNISGIGISMFDPQGRSYPLVTGEDVAINSDMKANSVVKEAGGVGAIISSQMFLDTALIFMAPGTLVNLTVAKTLSNDIHSTMTSSLLATMYKTEELKVRAPFVASFSSRGPNPGSHRVLKPDITAPGIDILASYTPLKSLTGLDGDKQHSKFTIMSGTSMACPHVAGVAAYVKSFHPNWSPAAIKSAIITSAKQMSQRTNKDAEFAYGAGQVNPLRASNPGLIYDMDEMSYINFLCKEGYKGSSLSVLVGTKSINCSTLVPATFGYDSLNYPSIQMQLEDNKRGKTTTFRRRVTNVGPAQSVYTATVRAPKGVNVTVSPNRLVFTKDLQSKSFKVVVKAEANLSSKFSSGSLIWRSLRHDVRSPIVVYLKS
ncbi:hypothetical protein V2J09_015228 [Rumex salicifolius]